MDADAALDRLAEGVRTVRKFNHPRILDAVTIEGVGTCSDALNRGAADLAREYDSLFVLHKSTSEAEVELELKVFGGATALRMQDQVGSLEPGKQADIVVFDTANFDLRPLHNPVANIVYGSTGHSVDTVLIGGEVVLRHKQLTSLDEAELRSQVEAINRRVLGEIGIAPLPRWPIV
jgi:5-methylthioadenosine/S-adenosylhomocysteine deaminase